MGLAVKHGNNGNNGSNNSMGMAKAVVGLPICDFRLPTSNFQLALLKPQSYALFLLTGFIKAQSSKLPLPSGPFNISWELWPSSVPTLKSSESYVSFTLPHFFFRYTLWCFT